MFQAYLINLTLFGGRLEIHTMKISRGLRWPIYIVGGLLTCILLVAALLAFVKIPIDLSNYKGPVESAATFALGRKVNVGEKIILTTSLRPFFQMEGLRIANPEGFKKADFMRMKSARLKVFLLPLLQGKIHIAEINVTGLSINLLENKQGAINWTLRPEGKVPAKIAGKSKSETPSIKLLDKSNFKLAGNSLVISRLFLKDILVSYQDAKMTSPAQFKIDECNGAMKAGHPFDLTFKGQLLEAPYVTNVNIASLEEFILKNRSWLTINTKIADTRFDLSGGIELEKVLKSLRLKVSVEGDRLDSLNRLLKIDLPPLKAYHGGGTLLLQKNRVDLTDLAIQVGESRLHGDININTSGTRPMVTVNMKAPRIQLDNFDTGDWSPEKDNTGHSGKGKYNPAQKENLSDRKKKLANTGQLKELISPEVLKTINVKMDVTADKVFSGKDELGSGNLTFSLKDGQLVLDPVQLNIPGGDFFLSASLRPDPAEPEASLKAVIKNFDFGIWVRHIKPKEKMGGIINLDLDLKSTAGRKEDLMKKGSGYFDYSGRLENLKSGVVDLWAVNLITAALSREKENESRINCVVGRWTLKDGLLTPDLFLIDTTKIRICGQGQIDFNKEYIDIKVAPVPKRPEYFNLATPLQIQGSFANLGIGIQPGGLFGTAVKFIVSPVTVSVKRMVNKDLPVDGSDVCTIQIGLDDRTGKSPEGCR